MPREKIEHYRIRAQELRAVTHNAASETARKHLESLADQYEQMAARIEASLPPVPPDANARRAET
jgi:hypothetical protein